MTLDPKLARRRELQAQRKPIYKTPWGILFAICLPLAGTSSVLLAATDMPASIVRNAWMCVTWALWLLTTVAFPVMAIQMGVVYGEGSSANRVHQPVRFWAALVIMSMLFAALLGFFTVVMRIAWFDG